MNTQIDPLKIAIAKHLERNALDELRTLVAANEKHMSNVPIDDLENRALALMERREVTPELIDIVSRTARVFYVAANANRGLYLAERLREQAERSGYGRSESILPLLNVIGLCALDTSDHVTATQVLDDGLRLADELSVQRFQVMFRTSLGSALLLAGLFAEASAVSGKSIQLALSEPKLISFVISCEANLLYANLILGKHTTSIPLITSRQFSKPPQSERETFARIYFEANSAQVYADIGHIPEAKRHLARAKKWLNRYKSTRAAMAVDMAEGFIEVCDGEFQKGLAAMTAVLPRANSVGAGATAYLPILSKAYDRAGRPQEVLRYTRTLIDQQVALQEKNILRHTRLNRAALDATTSETIIEESPNLLARLLTRAQILEGQVAKIELMNAQQKLFLQRTEMLERMAVMAALRDDGSGERVYRVGRLASLLTHMLGEDDHTVFMMEMAARLHDIGKISIPDSVVRKASVYAPAEHDMMKMHTTIGAELLAKSDITELQMAEQIARYHHERWDGTGYPEGLAGEAIPLPARVVALADVFDALTHPRPYRDAFTIDAAIDEISKASGSQFEPRLVEPFIKLIQLLRREQIADEHGNVPANLDDLLGQSAKASPLLLARQKIWASIDSVTEAKQALLATPPLQTSTEKTTKLIETLTPTEREVFKWVQLGKTNPEIAQILGSKAPTIKTHVQRIYRKLGINTRVGLARLGVE